MYPFFIPEKICTQYILEQVGREECVHVPEEICTQNIIVQVGREECVYVPD